MEGGGFEPPKLARQIYSLIPLATREPLPEKGRALSALATPLSTQVTPKNQADCLLNFGAGERSRTPDLLITSQLLYQLSYASDVR